MGASGVFNRSLEGSWHEAASIMIDFKQNLVSIAPGASIVEIHDLF